MTVRSVVLALSLAVAAAARAQHARPDTSAPAPAADLTTFNHCGMQGDARSPNVAALDALKNRWTPPKSADIDLAVTLAAMLAPGDDRTRWQDTKGALVIGYVHDVKMGGIETANCHAKARDERDTHIELVLDPADAAGPRRVIVEVTPRWRAIMAGKGAKWTTRALRDQFLGRWVKVTGWLLFDAEHVPQAENTAPGRARNWRGTAWEVHPVTGIEVTVRPGRQAR